MQVRELIFLFSDAKQSVLCPVDWCMHGLVGREENISPCYIYMTIVTVNFFYFCNGHDGVVKISITKWINLFYNFLFCFLIYGQHMQHIPSHKNLISQRKSVVPK